MFFVEWEFLQVVSCCFLLTGLSLWGLRYARNLSRLLFRVGLRFLCIPIGALASLLAVLLIAAAGCNSHSNPIYSPSKKLAVRITDSDGGATGGETSVDLYWAHGFREQSLYSGEWKSVKPSDIQWKSDTELTINYDGGYHADTYHFTPAAAIKTNYLAK
jgi:hypothetical protein